jgi:hypothetical protein
MKKITLICLIILVLSIFSFKAARAETLNQLSDFYVNQEYDLTGRSKLTAVLKVITDKFYIYFDKAWLETLDSATRDKIINKTIVLAYNFQNKDYTNLIQTFGPEPFQYTNPSDPRLILLVHPLKSEVGGYSQGSDLYPANVYTNSNQRNVVYFNANNLLEDNNGQNNSYYLAHEFTHLLTYNQKNVKNNKSETPWLAELYSEATSYLLGYDNGNNSPLSERLKDFSVNPHGNLGDWQNTLSDYAAVKILSQYIIDHYGFKVLTVAFQSNFIGEDSLDYSLKKWGYKENFSDIYRNWLLAVLLNDCHYGDKYCFKNEALKDLKIYPIGYYVPMYTSGVFNIEEKNKSLSGSWLKIVGGKGTVKINVHTDTPDKFKLIYLSSAGGNNYQIYDAFISNGTGEIYFPNFDPQKSAALLIPYCLNGSIKNCDYNLQVVSNSNIDEEAIILKLRQIIVILQNQLNLLLKQRGLTA